MRRICEVRFNDERYLANAGDLLLDWALMNDVELPHDCRAGRCGACRVRLVEGRVFGGHEPGDDMVHACQARIVSDIALKLPEDGLILLDEMSGFLVGVLLTSFALFLPVIFLVGVLTTFRIAGPLYRFEAYLRSLIRGEATEPCRIRKGDDLQGFCALLNEATASLRVRSEDEEKEEFRASA